MQKEYKVYVLRDIGTSLIVYAGLTSMTLQRRMQSHRVRFKDKPKFQIELVSDHLTLQEAVELAPQNEVYNLHLARVLRDTGHLSQAYLRFTHAVQKNPSDAFTWYEAGTCALANDDAEAAEKYFNRACSLSPSIPLAL